MIQFSQNTFQILFLIYLKKIYPFPNGKEEEEEEEELND